MNISKLNKYTKMAKQVEKLAEKFATFTDAELQRQTIIFREQLENGHKLESILVEAYAVVVEADYRVLGMRPYFVQIIGAIALFFGNVAEMKTGEGKTLSATMPLYLYGLSGKGNFLITANAYLAWRDAEDVGRVYSWLGLTLAIGVSREDREDVIDKESVYKADIVYTTHSSLGFDYLITNLATTPLDQHVNTFNFALIDEIDAVLLDMAQTPLIISGAPKVQSNLYASSDWFIKSITKDEDYELSEDRQSVWFTEAGILKAEKFFGITGILTTEWRDLYRHLVLALKANFIMEKDRSYVVDNDEVLLLDEANGRKLMGTKLQAGMHQAIEAKEQVTISNETKAMGTITYQNLFKKFSVLSGMTGTAKTDAEEFRSTYNIDVVVIPTNKPTIRKDHPDKVYVTNKAKILASLDEVKQAISLKRPVLIETGSVSMSNLYSLLLLQHKIPHNLLNATTVAKESWIISEAGKAGAVTVATSMAGRGTDIKLNEEAKKAGGLLVVGTERMTSERIDNQLRGRAGRQGDPGDSVFYVSMEDKVVVESAPKWVAKERKKLVSDTKLSLNMPLIGRKFKAIISKAQNAKKNQEYENRKSIIDYDEIGSIQREEIYAARNKVMRSSLEELTALFNKCSSYAIEKFVSNKDNLTLEVITDFIFNNIDYNYDISLLNVLTDYKAKTISEFLLKLINEKNQEVQSKLTDTYQLTYFKRVIILKALDMMWIEQADNLQQLKTVVSSRSWGQHRPIYEYQIEARRSFVEMRDGIWLNVVRNYLLSDLLHNEDGTIDIDFP